MMVLMRQTESYDMLVHMVMTDMKLLVVETKTADILADDVDTVFCSTDVGRSKQVGQKFVHSSIEPHWHDIHVDRDMHEVDRHFVYQVEHKSLKRSNEMNYPRFTKVIIDYFMTRKPSISRRNRIHWHYVRDDALFSTIKVVSRHQATQQYGAILPIELTTAEIRNSKAYQEYHACAMGEAVPKPKASARKKKGDSASSTTPPTPTQTTIVESTSRLGSGTGEGTGSKPGVPDVPSDDSEEELLWKSYDDEDVSSHEEGKKSDESDDDSDEGSDNDSDKTVKSGAGKDDDDGDDEDDDDNDDEEELAKDDEEGKETGKGGDEVRESEGEGVKKEALLIHLGRNRVNTYAIRNTKLLFGWSIWFIVWSIVLGEREEDSYLVINLSGKIIEYNLISKTLHEIYDIGSNQLDDDELIPPFAADHNVYQFILSFTSV
nr:hypothetical protein [Tanacetum cinerariifolium]